MNADDWPFAEDPPEMRDLLTLRQARDFFQAALAEGFRPYRFGACNVGASCEAGRKGIIDYRGGSRAVTRWGLILFRPGDLAIRWEDPVFGAALSDFGVGCEAVLRWLRGERVEVICALVQGSLWRDGAGEVQFGCWPGAGGCPGRGSCRAAGDSGPSLPSHRDYLRAWRTNAAWRNHFLASATRELSKHGDLDSHAHVYRSLASGLNPAEVAALYEQLRHSGRSEFEWRDQFLALFPQVGHEDLPPPRCVTGQPEASGAPDDIPF